MTARLWLRHIGFDAKFVLKSFLTTSLLAGGIMQASANTELVEELAARDYPLSLSGSYLAALTANKSRDLSAAALYYDRALAADPENVALVERAFLLRLADGKVEDAVKFTNAILERDPQNRFARMVLGAIALKKKSFKKAVNEFSQIQEGPLARLTGVLLHAWTLAGDGNYDGALDLLNKLEGPEWYTTFRHYHSGLIAELADKNELAAQNLKAAYEADPNVLRTTEAFARFQLRNGMEEEGKKLVKQLSDRLSNRPNIDELAADIAANRKPKRFVMTAQQGAMEVLFGLGSAIGREGGEEVSYVYLNLAAYLAPEDAQPRLALAELLEADEQFQRAIDNYAAISDTSIHKTNALIRTAFAYNSLDKLDEARKLMVDLIKRQPDNLIALTSYGNILRSHDLFDEGRAIYTDAIRQIGATPQEQDWALYYSRGITNERTKRWSEAEADFRQALKLSPNQPQVLNYLGYSFIDMGLNYDEAIQMIKTAVRLRPDDAFIIDSLGWAYFKLKDYKNAVLNLERAVELRPQDPILNDHLGDAYWHIGRKLEAVFQWSHARDLDPLPEDKEKIVKKIENGFIPDKDG